MKHSYSIKGDIEAETHEEAFEIVDAIATDLGASTVTVDDEDTIYTHDNRRVKIER